MNYEHVIIILVLDNELEDKKKVELLGLKTLTELRRLSHAISIDPFVLFDDLLQKAIKEWNILYGTWSTYLFFW